MLDVIYVCLTFKKQWPVNICINKNICIFVHTEQLLSVNNCSVCV